VNILQEFCGNDVLQIYRWVGIYDSNKHMLITMAKHFAFHIFHNEEDGLFLDENAEEESIMCFGIFIARVLLSLITIPLKMTPRFWEMIRNNTAEKRKRICTLFTEGFNSVFPVCGIKEFQFVRGYDRFMRLFSHEEIVTLISGESSINHFDECLFHL
jgi:hypothetical protein